MKSIPIYLSLLFLNPFFIPPTLSDRLCNDNEEIIISFKSYNQKMVVSICKEKSGKYLVYRSGRKNNITEQFPYKLDKTSWTLFRYKIEWPNDKQKDNIDSADLVLEFKYLDSYYRIFQRWNKKDTTRDFGLEVEPIGTKAKILVVNKLSLIGSLKLLNDITHFKEQNAD